ncbi:hypothetical protein [Aestuariibaculum lutulentum]|uniref:Uncharacterized protein n=1 Tax=Aestuariibaculum lutulentum TaxID=2920935 RepID=A0ABS9RJV7_9FLAO|nr:hypothetical protein [Aestuariibaculum lutulentum]MCH4553239.1 hypothetical protein [Aestuariibaculum lutulentum]
MKKAFFKYLLFLLVFVLNGYNQLYANVIEQDNHCLPCIKHNHSNQVSADHQLNFTHATSDESLDLKVTEIEIEESEKALSKKIGQDNAFTVFHLASEHYYNINNKSLIPNGLFCYTLFSKRHILFQVFRI